MPNSLLHRCSPPQQVRTAGELDDEVPNLGAILLELPKTISRLLTVPPPKKVSISRGLLKSPPCLCGNILCPVIEINAYLCTCVRQIHACIVGEPKSAR